MSETTVFHIVLAISIGATCFAAGRLWPKRKRPMPPNGSALIIDAQPVWGVWRADMVDNLRGFGR